MTSKKSQISKNATKSVGGSTSSSTSTGPMTRNKAKAMRLLTSQEVKGKAPMTKLISASAQPKTVISLSILRTSKHSSSRKGDSSFIPEDLMIGSEYHYSASDAGLSNASQSGSSQGSPREVTSSIFSENSSQKPTEKKEAKCKEGGEPLTRGPQPNSEVRQKFCEEKKEAPMVLRYVPTSKRKEGQSPFGLTMGAKDKCKKSIQEEDIAILKSDFTLPLSKSAFDRLGSTNSSTNTPQPKEEKSGLQKRKGTEAYSLIPSRMKHELVVEISIENSLKVKQWTTVHTQELEKQVNNGEEDHETLVLPSCHVAVETDSESDASDDEPNEAPRAIEDGWQATVNELKELNLGTDEEPRPIYVSSLLTPEEESKYFELFVRINALKSYCMMLCMTLCMT
nr:hypothetical protein CFP56_59447 [Quercus suber]